MLCRIVTLGLLTTTCSLGCMSGPLGSTSKDAMENVSSSPSQVTDPLHGPPGATPAIATKPIGPPPAITEQQALEQVTPMLEKIAAADGELHAETLRQLSDVKPSLWSLTVQRAINTLEYRQQLANQTKSPSTPTNSIAPLAPSQVAGSTASMEGNQVVQASASETQRDEGNPDSPALSMVANSSSAPESFSNPHFQVVKSTTTDASPGTEASLVTSNRATPERMGRLPKPNADKKNWRDHLAAAIAQLDREAATKPRSSDEAYQRVRLQLLQLVAGQTDDASKATPGLSSAEQGYWSNQIYALATLLSEEGSEDPQTRADAATRHLIEASAKLRSLGSLQIRNFVTCREVYGYGAYDPMDEARYAPGDQVILYAEIDNYKSKTTDNGYRTTIASSYRLVTLDGKEVASGDFPEVDDLCLTRRRDFHIQYGVTLPTALAAGDYRLELTVNDRLGDKIGHDQLPLAVVGR